MESDPAGVLRPSADVVVVVVVVAEEELDELNIHAVRYRPEELAKLTRTTKFTRKEIQLIYRGFKQVSR